MESNFKKMRAWTGCDFRAHHGPRRRSHNVRSQHVDLALVLRVEELKVNSAVCGNRLSSHINLKVVSSIRLSRFNLLDVSEIHICAAGETYTQRVRAGMINRRVSADVCCGELLKAPIEAAIRDRGFESAIPDNGIVHRRGKGPA